MVHVSLPVCAHAADFEFSQQGQHAVGSCQLTLSAVCVHATLVFLAVNKNVAAWRWNSPRPSTMRLQASDSQHVASGQHTVDAVHIS